MIIFMLFSCSKKANNEVAMDLIEIAHSNERSDHCPDAMANEHVKCTVMPREQIRIRAIFKMEPTSVNIVGDVQCPFGACTFNNDKILFFQGYLVNGDDRRTRVVGILYQNHVPVAGLVKNIEGSFDAFYRKDQLNSAVTMNFLSQFLLPE
jgi:hypothetical protein